MFDELFQPLTDEQLEGYMNHLKMRSPMIADRTYLDHLIRTHQMQVVFENLDSWHFKKQGGLGTAELYNKIIERKRGGYCFELNALYHALLLKLGYDAAPCMCRILEGEAPERSQISHRGELVRLDGQLLYTDVGFGGPQPPFSVAIQENYKQTKFGETFFVRQYDENWWTLFRINSKGREEAVLQFTIVPQSPVDFLALHYYIGGKPDGEFATTPIFNRRTEKGNIGIYADELSIRVDGNTVRKKLETKKEILEMVEKYFLFPESFRV